MFDAFGRCTLCGEQATTGGCLTHGCPNGPVRVFVNGEVVPVSVLITPLEYLLLPALPLWSER